MVAMVSALANWQIVDCWSWVWASDADCWVWTLLFVQEIDGREGKGLFRCSCMWQPRSGFGGAQVVLTVLTSAGRCQHLQEEEP